MLTQYYASVKKLLRNATEDIFLNEMHEMRIKTNFMAVLWEPEDRFYPRRSTLI